MLIYHIADPKQWERALETGYYEHPTLKTEGFIHCSFHEQLETNADKHFANVEELLVLHISDKQLKPILKTEQTGGATQPYPHLYGKIPLTSVVNLSIVSRNAEGLREWWWLE